MIQLIDIIHYGGEDYIFDTSKIYDVQQKRPRSYIVKVHNGAWEIEKMSKHELHMIISENMADNVIIFYGINNYMVNVYTIVEVNGKHGICKEN